MSATVLKSAVSVISRLPKRRLEHVYPLFGFRWRVLQMPLADRHVELHNWLLRQDRIVPHESWSSRWERCQRECSSCFKEIWIVRLPRRSRSLDRGDYAFDPVTDFLHIPGSPPEVVKDCYREAFSELPRHRFAYLDLLWDTTPSGLQLISVEKLLANMLQLELQFKRRMRNDQLLIKAACIRLRKTMRTVSDRDGAVRNVKLPTTTTEARRILGLSDDQLQRSLQVQIQAFAFIKFDPVIVFEEPGLLERARGYMPLGLIAHWD